MEKLTQHMKECMQTESQNVLEHGQDVWMYFQELMYHTDDREVDFKLPSWFTDRNIQSSDCYSYSTMKNYLIYHDCGKPYCKATEDRKFPDHAEMSYKKWLAVGGDPVEANLMRHDMCVHTRDHETFSQLPRRMQISLLCASIAELHSNAAMFGGKDSTSFKIKWKALDRFGKRYFSENSRIN